MTTIASRLDDIRRQLVDIIADGDAAISKAPDGLAKGQLLQSAWTCRQMLNGCGPYFSQAGQDEYLDRAVFNRARGGVFVEIGAYDGIAGSNTLFFEMCRGWRGLLVEASPSLQSMASNRRRSPCIAVAVAPEAGEAEFLEVTSGYLQMGGLVRHMGASERQAIDDNRQADSRVIRVPTRPLADILREHGLRHVDYLSIDVEGAEQAILECFPFDAFDIQVWSIEVNTGDDEIASIMRNAGYARTAFIG
jgi:FkbM family methyltransferase